MKKPRFVMRLDLDRVVGGNCQADAARLGCTGASNVAACLGSDANFPKVSPACKAQGLISEKEFQKRKRGGGG